MQQDTARPEDSERVVRYAVDTYGALHFEFNNAGIGGDRAPAGETDLADWARVININLNGTMYCVMAVLPQMRKRKEGLIINVSSWFGRYWNTLGGPGYIADWVTMKAVTAADYSIATQVWTQAKAVMVISHDKAFIDNITNRIHMDSFLVNVFRMEIKFLKQFNEHQLLKKRSPILLTKKYNEIIEKLKEISSENIP